ncbi:replication initiation factor domain-containing protein [Vibrio astriarenae]
MNKCLIDYLSFSGTPTLLMRCKEMAKERFSFDTPDRVDHPTGLDQSRMNQYMADNIGSALSGFDMSDFLCSDHYQFAVGKYLTDVDLVVNQDLSFNDCYQHLIANIGIDMLDTLCHGEIESFLEVLNHEITYQGNVWTMSKRGGFSGYKSSAVLLCNGAQAGLVAWGAENFGYYVSFSGVGCAAVDMAKLHAALKQMPDCKITRCDVAYDDFEGTNTIRQLRKQYVNGMFITRGKPPKYGYIETGSLSTSDDKKKCGLVADGGATFYVGDRRNGKLFRGYEKGKQLKSADYPKWVRLEVQFGNKSRVIPLEILIEPDSFFTGAYPALSHVVAAPCKIIPITRVIANASLDRFMDTARKQYGKFVNFLKVIYEDNDKVVELMTKGLTAQDIPERLNMPCNSLTQMELEHGT